MKCNSCSIDIPKEFKVALQKNVCPSCGKAILVSGNPGAFGPLCELIDGAFELSKKVVVVEGDEPKQEIDQNHQSNVEELATLILTTFNVRLKTDKDQPEVAETDPDALHKKKQLEDGRSMLEKMRQEAYDSALRKQYGMESDVEAPLDPDLGEKLAGLAGGMEDVGDVRWIESKQQKAQAAVMNGSAKVRRS